MVTPRKVGKYQVGRTIGEGTFAKVKFAQNLETGESVAIKVMAKNAILKHRMVDQIRREISIMKIVRHPNIVRLHEVLASRTKIYIILEFVTGGELFDKIVHQGKLPENLCRKYFQQLIDAVAHCHSKGVYHRDLKPENLLLDFHGNLKVSDFGLSALPQPGVGLLHTTCGTPNYVAPEVLGQQGYDGAAADIWSCGVILFVIMAGYLPFDEMDLPSLYKKINAAEFSCPFWFSPGAKSLIPKILDPNPKTRIDMDNIRKHPWFCKNYVPVKHREHEDVDLNDVHAVFDDIEEKHVAENSETIEGSPLMMNAFEMITLSQGLNLSALFDRGQDHVKRQTRFVSRKPAQVVISSIEAVGKSMGLKVHTRNFKTRIEGISANRIGQFAVVLEVYEVAPSLFMVDVRKAAGDTLEYHKFYKNLCAKLEDIILKPTESLANASLLRTMTC
ncbi:CBL-interacting serine/threonine-protein kinase 24-like isoform X1 [Rhodamnia argentea]|uniref:non-specific serine/threonine protein kinase n=2 Tax=Rhodamnia argentea TaxID=178133 RepID=A0A8B8R112_9MYRT|nr:CBL-interacting serine/threonine-protein kinase 24-like isoform X1 [Rhodamnia argentea]XP_030553061.1 CBL-interacting serine/threonine-protein kinase 24-like isoform X1 [Rhodamnia argentea]XP_048134219.1 CBL-interacting serine/threonine-protein kinase 24-like isoform X1 [Rhodamnia argentea]